LNKATVIDYNVFFGWQDLSNCYTVFLLSQAIISYLSLTSFVINNSYPAEDLLQALDPALLDKPFNRRFLYNILRCKSTFTRLGDRNQHIKSKYNVTLHFCLVLKYKKSFARDEKGYTRKNKLQEHIQRKYVASVKAAV
jgi:hypothetical protein